MFHSRTVFRQLSKASRMPAFSRSFTSELTQAQSNKTNRGLIFGGAVFGASAIGMSMYSTQHSNADAKSGLDPKKFNSFKLKDVQTYNHNTKLFVFDLADKDAEAALPIASFVVTKAPIGANGKNVFRPYTPIDQDERGVLKLLVKVYPDGNMSKHFGELRRGDSLDIKGPLPKLKYEANMKKNIGMIAGGTGITPMLQVATAILENPKDKTQVTLVFANETQKDILLKEKIDELAGKYDNFKVHYVVSKPENGFEGTVGYINEGTIKKYIPGPSSDNLVLICGPPPMLNAISGGKAKDYSQGEVGGILKKLGYTSDLVYKF